MSGVIGSCDVTENFQKFRLRAVQLSILADLFLGMAFVAFKRAIILVWTTFSRIFNKYGTFDTGLKFFVSRVSSPTFLKYFLYKVFLIKSDLSLCHTIMKQFCSVFLS